MRAEILVALGRDSEALPWLESIADASVPELIFLAPSYRRRAEILERLGDRSGAAEMYKRFISLWEHGDQHFRFMVDSARVRVAALNSNAPLALRR